MLETQFVLELKKRKKIIIYGAGMVGKLVYSRLIANGLKDNIIGFAVSNKTIHTYMGIPVYAISELVAYKDSADVIIATFPFLQEEIENTLNLYRFCYIYKVSENLYKDMSENYIVDFKKEHLFDEKTVDVLLMASDNNSSSGAFLCMVDLCVELNERNISSVVVLPTYGNGEDILSKKNIDFVYISSKDWTEKIDEKVSENEEFFEKENRNSIAEIENFIVQHQVKLIHNNTSYTYVGAIAAQNTGIPYIWHIRENIFKQGFKFINYEKAIDCINRSEKIIGVSKYITSSYPGLDNSKIHVCYDGVNIEDYYHEKRIFESKKIIIAQIGVIAPLKNQKELIEAAYFLKKQQLDFQVQLIGSGEIDYIKELKRIINELQLKEEIVFYGRQDNVSVFYQNADIVTVCSRVESFGRTTVEAQLAGCLVIGANAGATSELVKDGKTGFLYKPGNSKELAEKIIYAIQHPELSREIAFLGQQYSYKNYSKEKNAENIIEIYQSIYNE